MKEGGDGVGARLWGRDPEADDDQTRGLTDAPFGGRRVMSQELTEDAVVLVGRMVPRSRAMVLDVEPEPLRTCRERGIGQSRRNGCGDLDGREQREQ